MNEGRKFPIQEKVAFVTGANRGIGKSIVASLLQHGAKKVYAAVRNIESAAPLIKEYGNRVTSIHIDLENPDSIKQAAANANDVELVINSAGILCPSDLLDEKALDTLEREMKVNVFGLLHMGQEFAPVLKANGGGAFVQLNSGASLLSFPGTATYAASKAAAYSITQGLRDALQAQGTVVVSVHPGPIDTDMVKKTPFQPQASPSVVAEGIVHALEEGVFHLFPDPMAERIWAAYQSFAEEIVEKSFADPAQI